MEKTQELGVRRGGERSRLEEGIEVDENERGL